VVEESTYIMNKTRSLTGRARARLVAPANRARLLLAVASALLTACGSSTNTDLFGKSVGDEPKGRGTGGNSVDDRAGAPGSGGGNGDAGANAGTGGFDTGGTSSVFGGGAGGISGGSGAGGIGGGSGAARGDAGTAGVTNPGGAGGDQGAGGTQAGGTTGSGGSVTGGIDGGSGGAPEQPPCVTKPSQTVLIGDSYVNWTTHTFQADLARQAGASFRLYAMGGASMATGGITTLIPDQFENGVRADKDIRVVIMDGGGNDILVPAATWIGGGTCKNRADSPSVPVCQQIVQASLDREQVLMDRMADVGVRDVVFFFYPTVPNGTILGGTNPNAIASWASPKVKAGCEGAYDRTGRRLRCHFVDMVPVFKGHPEYFATGDIHPNTSGSAAMAKAVWETMTSACVAQKAGSGCCQP
jgi:hypothetical protein